MGLLYPSKNLESMAVFNYFMFGKMLNLSLSSHLLSDSLRIMAGKCPDARKRKRRRRGGGGGGGGGGERPSKTSDPF
jgi:hypothetical protein